MFGGKSVFLGGDFRQILHVLPEGTKDEIIHALFCSSVPWPKFKVMSLKKNICLSPDGLSIKEKNELVMFAKWILSIGNETICDSLL